MKDFLQDRPLASGAARRRPDASVNSSLPPIHSLHSQPADPGFSGIETCNPPEAELHNPASCAEPHVELVPDEAGRIGHIVVTCSCGEKITLQCNY